MDMNYNQRKDKTIFLPKMDHHYNLNYNTNIHTIHIE